MAVIMQVKLIIIHLIAAGKKKNQYFPLQEHSNFRDRLVQLRVASCVSLVPCLYSESQTLYFTRIIKSKVSSLFSWCRHRGMKEGAAYYRPLKPYDLSGQCNCTTLEE